MFPQPYNPKSVPPPLPIIGIAGGIGSGKTHIANLFGQLGCFVIHSDDQIRLAYTDPKILAALRDWWGSSIFKPDNTIDRQAIAKRIFTTPADRLKLEQLLHPWVLTHRDQLMRKAAQDPATNAFIWDTPLLYETGLDRDCTAVVFIESDLQTRKNRVIQSRGWNENEIILREKFQWPLDKKRNLAHYVLVNSADAAKNRSQVREILSRILAKRPV